MSTRPSVEGRFSTVAAVNQSSRCCPARQECSVTYPWRPCVGASERTGLDGRGYARMLWRRAEERTDGQRSGEGGAGLAVHGGREGRRWVSQAKVGGVAAGKGWHAEPWRRCCWKTRVLAAPICTRWRATLPNASRAATGRSLKLAEACEKGMASAPGATRSHQEQRHSARRSPVCAVAAPRLRCACCFQQSIRGFPSSLVARLHAASHGPLHPSSASP